MNNARHVGNKQASCFYYQTMQTHKITWTPIVCKGSQNHFITNLWRMFSIWQSTGLRC